VHKKSIAKYKIYLTMKITVKPNTAIRPYLKGKKTIQWTTGAGEVLYIEDMVDAHLNNAINMLGRMDSVLNEQGIVLRCMRIERSKRQYSPDGEIAEMLQKQKEKLCNKINITQPFNFNTK